MIKQYVRSKTQRVSDLSLITPMVSFCNNNENACFSLTNEPLQCLGIFSLKTWHECLKIEWTKSAQIEALFISIFRSKWKKAKEIRWKTSSISKFLSFLSDSANQIWVKLIFSLKVITRKQKKTRRGWDIPFNYHETILVWHNTNFASW